MKLLLTIAATFIVFMPSNAFAQVFEDQSPQSSGTNAVLGIGLRSDRMFRGQNLYNGVSLQPHGNLDFPTGPNTGTLHIGFFSHVALDQEDTQTQRGGPFQVADPDDASGETLTNVSRVSQSFNELDLDLGYAFMVDTLDVDIGHRWLLYDESNVRLGDTAELYGRVTLDSIARPSLMLAYDWDEGNGWYYELGVSEAFAVSSFNEGNVIIPSLTIGGSQNLDGPRGVYDDNGLVFVDVGLKGVVFVTPEVSLEPEIHYNEAIDDFADSEFWFGINLTAGF